MRYTAAILLLLYLGIRISLQSPAVQTRLTQKIASLLSDKLNARVSVEGVDVELIRTFVLKGLLIEDQRQDTLIYAGYLKGDIADLKFSENRYSLSEIILQDAKFSLKYYEGDTVLNLQFIIDSFSSGDTSGTGTKTTLLCDKIILQNSYFSYDDFNRPLPDFGFDHNHIAASEINAEISDILIDGDTISADLTTVSANERSGLVLENLSAKAIVCPAFIALNYLKLVTGNSEIDGDILFTYSKYADFYDFLDKVKISSHLVRTELNLSDIAYFAYPLKGIDKKIIFSGDFKGNISNLKGKNMVIQFGPNSFFKGDIALDGLPDIEETFITLDIKNIETNRRDLESIPIPPFDSAGYLALPENISLLGKMGFSGNFTGFINDFVALGKLRCALGEINSDLKLSMDTASKKIFYDGKVATAGFNIGKLLRQDTLLGLVAGDLQVKGQGMKKENMHLNLNGNIAGFDFKKYRYGDIKVEGEMTQSKFNGLLVVQDKNLNMEFDGNIDFEPALPVFNFESRILSANLYALHLLKRDSVTSLSLNSRINFSGNTIDNVQGSVHLTNIRYGEGKNSFEVDSVKLQAFTNESGKVLKLESDVASGQLQGNFLVAELAPSFNHILSQILPSYYEKKVEKPQTLQQFTYNIDIYNTEKITGIFAPDLMLKTIHLTGKYNSDDKEMVLAMETPDLKYGKTALTDFMLDLHSAEDVLTVNSTSKRFNLSDSLWLENVDLVFKLTNDHVQFGYSWQNEPDERGLNYRGSINGLASIYKNNKFSVRFLSSDIVIADSVWKFADNNEIFIDSSSIAFRNFIIQSANQQFSVNGKISESSSDALNIFLENFDLGNFNVLTEPAGISLGGIINGSATVANPYSDILFNSDISFNDLAFNNESLGNGEFISIYNSKAGSISINGSLGRDEARTILLEGFYYPEQKENALDLTATINDLQLSLFSGYTTDIVSKLKGTASGKINIRGMTEAPELSGKVNVRGVSFLFDYLNTHYSLEDAVVVIEKNWIGFNNVTATDIKGNKALATGTIVHDNFKNLNMDISIDAKNFQALNTNVLYNSLYYGKAYMTGYINISGNPDNLVIDINGKSEKGTEFFIPLSGPAEVSEHDFIQFVTKDTLKIKAQKEYEVNLSGIQLNFKLEVTPEARIELIFDETAGDIMKARGRGNLMLEINTLGNFNMYGEYVVTEGDYLFTLENIINKKFIVKDGGTITWNGNPYDAQFDLDAVYKLRAPLSDIVGDTTMTKRVPVECHMLMTGKIMNPDIKFDIQLPTVDEFTRQEVYNKFKTSENEMNQQVFSLLIMNRFYPEQGGVSTGGDLAGTSASELLSNQLSNWLSQTTDIVNLGVSYRSGDEVTTQEVELALSKQLFNDRVYIEGNVGVGGTSTTTAANNNNLMGDVNVEYKISDDGRFRAKMFNEANDYNLANANQSPYTQGVGVFYREEFNTFRQFFTNMFRRKKKKDDEKNGMENGNGNRE